MGHGNTLTRAFALELADTIDEAWHELLFGTQVRRAFDHWRGVALFKQFHGHGEPEAPLTALLVCTDRRWRSCTHRLVRGIEDTGILPGDQLDELARRFIERDAIEVVVRASGRGRTRAHTVTRSVLPPLRRWAAARLVRCTHSAREYIDRAIELDPAHGAAVVAGVLDALEALDDESAASAIEIGLAWPRSSARLVALELLAGRAGIAEAVRRAANDPDAKVRQWGAKLARQGRPAQLDVRAESPQPELFET